MNKSKELNFNIPFIGLDNKPIVNNGQIQTVGYHFSHTLASIQQGNPQLLMNWAKAIYNNQPLTVSQEDLQILIQIATLCSLPAILREQLLGILSE